MTAEIDYYSEDIPACEDEPEILESLPINRINDETTTYDDNSNPDIITDNTLVDKIRLINSDFESKIKDKILFNSNTNISNNSSQLSLESKKRNKLLKFTLLENELRSLMIEIENDNEILNSNLENKINNLVNDVDNFKLKNKNEFIDYWESKLNDLNFKVTSENITLIDKEKSDIDLNSNSKFLNFESRISNLENKISIDSLDSSTPSIRSSIDDLYTRVNLLLDNNDNLRSIENEISKLIDNCEKYIKDSKRIRDKYEIIPLTDRKLNILYDKMKNLPDFNSLIDKIMIRFRSLNKLIIETSNTVNFMNGLKSELLNIDNKLDVWDTKLNQLESNFNKDNELFKSISNKILVERKS